MREPTEEGWAGMEREGEEAGEKVEPAHRQA